MDLPENEKNYREIKNVQHINKYLQLDDLLTNKKH